MEPQLILHIPHASTNVPDYSGYLVSPKIVDQEAKMLCDLYTDDLFEAPNELTLKANFSRVFCDVERFADDAKEPMSKFGMGSLYTKLDNGKDLRKITPEYRAKVFANYYYEHHNQLDALVKSQLDRWDKALIIDCHSFPNIPFNRSLDTSGTRPDFCIGTDDFHTSKSLEQVATQFFKAYPQYTLGINSPYIGSMVPNAFYGKDKRVQSIMLEVNRDLYMDAKTYTKTSNYPEIKNVVSAFLSYLKTDYFSKQFNANILHNK